MMEAPKSTVPESETDDPPFDPPLIGDSRTRRRNRKRRSAKKKADSADPAGDFCCTTLSDEWAKDNDVCAIDSWNMNAWTTGHTKACQSSADVVLLQ